MHPLILGVFAYLDSVPEDSMPERWEATWEYLNQPERRRKQKLADSINSLLRLQSRECPLRPLLAGYRLYFRDDMALALAHAYMLHKDGKDPEEALTADYCRALKAYSRSAISMSIGMPRRRAIKQVYGGIFHVTSQKGTGWWDIVFLLVAVISFFGATASFGATYPTI